MEEIKNTTEAAKNASELATNFYSDLRPIVQPVAKCIGAVLDLAVSPVLYYSQKAQMNFKRRLEQYQKKMESVKEEDRCEVHPEIGVPIMQVLHYTTNDDIAEMFTNLLASASISSMARCAHPAFVEFIKHMSPDEAMIVRFLKGKDFIPYLTLQANLAKPNKGFLTPIENAVSICSEVKLIYPENVKVYISNLLSLGIIVDANSLHLMDDRLYEKVKQDNNLEEEKANLEKDSMFESVVYKSGYYYISDIGKLFINACYG